MKNAGSRVTQWSSGSESVSGIAAANQSRYQTLAIKVPSPDPGKTQVVRSGWTGNTVLIISGGLLISLLVTLYLIYRHQEASVDRLLIDPQRDYTLVPFSMMDAAEYCRRKMVRRYGSALAHSYIDEHSTRFDSTTGFYKVFMFARIGSINDYEEEAVHCFVDPESRMLTHYRTINLNKASLMSRAAKFFQRF